MRLTTALGPQDPGASRSWTRCGGPRRRRRPLLGPEPLEHRALPANTFLVTGLGDTGAASGPLAGDLRYCLTHAQDGDTITFDQDLSGPTTTTVDLTTVGDTTFGPSAFLISKAITIDGSAVTNLVIERSAAAGTPNFRIFDVAATGSLTLEHLTVSNGVAQDDGQAGVTPGSSDAQGGGILDDGGDVTLVDATVANNQAQGVDGRDAQGGGIYAAGGTVELTGATLSGNTARGGNGADSTSGTMNGANGGRGQGGGLYASGGTLSVDGATVANNTAVGGSGGKGYYNFYISVYTDSGTGGFAQGGGIDTAGVGATLAGVTITGNTATGGTGGPSASYANSRPGAGGDAQGGGMHAEGGTVHLAGTTLSGNTAGGGRVGLGVGATGGRGQGGGLDTNGADLLLENVTASNDIARGGDGGGDGSGGPALGGGVSASGGSATLNHVVITGNSVLGGPGEAGGNMQGAGVAASVVSATLTDVTITGNSALGATTERGGGSVQGGAVHVSATSVLLDHDTIANNTALGGVGGDGSSVQGGGLDLAVGAGGAMLTNDTISGNTATSGSGPDGFKVTAYGTVRGGGVYASVGAGSRITLNNDTITGNSAINRPAGGGLYLSAGAGAQVTLAHDTITDNVADGRRNGAGDAAGGGLFASGGSATLDDVLIAHNSALGGGGSGWATAGAGQGGGLYAAGVNATLTGDTITGNTASGGVYANGTFFPPGASQGGGVFATGGHATLTNDTISGNTALGASFSGGLPAGLPLVSGPAQGGGVFASGVSLTLANVTVAGNSALGGHTNHPGPGGAADGGGLYVRAANGGRVTLVNATIARNASRAGAGAPPAAKAEGGGLEVAAGPVTLENTLIALNTASVGNGPDTPSDIGGAVDPASAFNLIGTGGAGGLAAGADGNQVGVTDPRLGPLADNGGPILTIAPLPGSPAIDRGGNAAAAAYGLTTDQRGFARVVNRVVDVGAVEVQVTVAAPAAAQGGLPGRQALYDLGSFADARPGAGPWSVAVGWGDGTPGFHFTAAAPGPLGRLPHTYAAPGSYTVTVTVADARDDATQMSFPVLVADGPRVTAVQRFGYHARPTALVVHFDQPLAPGPSQDLANYRLSVLGRTRPIRVVSASYDPSSWSVVLRPARLLPLHDSYVLTVSGSPPGGVAGTQGLLLDGSGQNQPGTDYTTTVTRQNLVITPPLRVAVRSAVGRGGPHGPAALWHRARR